MPCPCPVYFSARGYVTAAAMAISRTLPPCAACRIVGPRQQARGNGPARFWGNRGGGGHMMAQSCRTPAWVALAFAAFACHSAVAQAQTGYPDHAVKIIVPIGPGGSYDLVGRQIADVLSRRAGQSFFVENKPGAGTVVGTQAAAQSEADGYTLLVGGLSNMAFNSALYSKLAYDPLKVFVPVALAYRCG